MMASPSAAVNRSDMIGPLAEVLAGSPVQMSLFVLWSIVFSVWLLLFAHLRPVNSGPGWRTLAGLAALLSACKAIARLLTLTGHDMTVEALDSLGDGISLIVLATLLLAHVPLRSLATAWRKTPTSVGGCSPCDGCAFRPVPTPTGFQDPPSDTPAATAGTYNRTYSLAVLPAEGRS